MSGQAEFDRDFSEPKANVVLVSEDGVKFKLPDYMLKSAS